KHPGVVGRETAGQALHEVVVSQDGQIPLVHLCDTGLDQPADPLPLLRRHQPGTPGQELGHGPLTAGAAEDEGDRRQQPLPVQPVDDLRPAGGAAGQAADPLVALPLVQDPTAAVPTALAPTVVPAVGSTPSPARPTGVLPAPPGIPLGGRDTAQELGVDA